MELNAPTLIKCLKTDTFSTLFDLNYVVSFFYQWERVFPRKRSSVRMSAKAQLLELIRNLTPEQAAALIPTLEVLKSEFAKPSQPVPQKDPVQTP